MYQRIIPFLLSGIRTGVVATHIKNPVGFSPSSTDSRKYIPFNPYSLAIPHFNVPSHPMLTDISSDSSTTLIPVERAPEYTDYTQSDIYSMLSDPLRVQQMVIEGSLNITRIGDRWPEGTSPVFIVSLHGYAAFASLERRLRGEVALKVGDIRIPLSFLRSVLTPESPVLLPVTSRTEALVPVEHNALSETLMNIRRILNASAATPSRPSPATLFPPATITLTRPTASQTPVVTDSDGDASLHGDDDATPQSDAATILPSNPSPALTLGGVLQELDGLILRINNPSIKKQTLAVKSAIIALAKQGEEPALLIQAIHLTNQLLTADPAGRSAIAGQCQALTLPRRNDPSPAWQALGIAMIVLGALITGLGTLTCLAVPNPVGIASVIGGATLLAGGIGMFARGCPYTHPQKLMQNLSTSIEKHPEAILPLTA